MQTDPRNDKRQFAKHFGLVSTSVFRSSLRINCLDSSPFTRKEEHAFNDDEIEFLSTLAGQSRDRDPKRKTLRGETRRSER